MEEQSHDVREDQDSADFEGVFGVHKPLGITSQRAVQIVKYWARSATGNKKVKVGHGGTLDPLAQGVLIVAIGRTYTKQIDAYVAAQKEYVAEITLGKTSTTDDEEGDKTITDSNTKPTVEDVHTACSAFVGEVSQIPPTYSAIKINGQEAYKRTRRGEDVVMQPRLVEIFALEVLTYTYPVLTIRVVCGKGTYIRSLARDIGEALRAGAYMSALTRTRVGNCSLEDCKSLEDFAQ